VGVARATQYEEVRQGVSRAYFCSFQNSTRSFAISGSATIPVSGSTPISAADGTPRTRGWIRSPYALSVESFQAVTRILPPGSTSIPSYLPGPWAMGLGFFPGPSHVSTALPVPIGARRNRPRSRS
jgi:hypothetical protein